MSARCLYLDLDGTLLGKGASLLHDGEGAVAIDGVRAVQACLRAGVEVVLMSGRRKAQLAEDARLLGGSSYIYEAGACVVVDGEEHWLTGDMQPGELTIAQQIERSGAPALLLEHYGERLEHHDPWHTDREVSHLFRGLVDAGEADRVLAEHGYEGAAAGGQRRGEHALPEAGGPGAGARLPPRAGGRVEGGGGGIPPTRARVCARGDLRGGGLARGHGVRAARADLLAGGERPPARPDDRGDDRAVRERARVRGRRTERACTRRS